MHYNINNREYEQLDGYMPHFQSSSMVHSPPADTFTVRIAKMFSWRVKMPAKPFGMPK